jgi:hypothetical protein
MNKNGKKVIYVNSNIYSEKVDKENFTKNSVGPQIPDGIRYYSGNFWTTYRNSLQKASVDPIYNISKVDSQTIALKADQTKFYEDTFENGLLVKKFNKNSWKEFIENIIPPTQQIFEDYYISFPEPTNIPDIGADAQSGGSFINREFVYNFFSPSYETLIGDPVFDVTLLPTIYNVLANKQAEIRTEEENLILSLGGFIGSSYVDSLSLATKTTDLVKQYFDQYAKTFVMPEVAPVKRQIKQYNTKVNVDSERLQLVKKLNNKYVPFPHYMEATFTNIASSENNFIHTIQNYGTCKDDLLEFIKNQFVINNKNFIYSNNVEKPTEISIAEVNLKNWIDENINSVETSVETSVSYSDLIKYIKNNIKVKAREYIDLLSKPAFFDTVFYKIEKRQFNYKKENKPISTLYITPDKSEIIKYIDTQIKYGTDYYYTISAYTLVVGAEYSYNPYYPEISSIEKANDIAKGEYKLKVSTKPTYKVLEIPLAKIDGAVYETPYTKPVIKVDQRENNVLFSLRDSSTESYEQFEIVENNDFKLFEAIRMAQDNSDENTIYSKLNPLSAAKLQIYRTTTYPTNFLSFQNKLFKTLVLDQNNRNFTDSIISNTKYYYMFRYLNEHGVPSNVSDVIEVQIINEDGYYYIDTKTIDMKMPFPKTVSKGMKKYLLIRPSIIQVQPKFDKEIATVDDVQLGPAGDNVWNKDFTLKLTSNKSNRVIKLNFRATINKKNQ